MKLQIGIPALLFPAASFLLLPFTNRYLTLASLIRNLLKEWHDEADPHIAAQISILKQRVNLIRFMQSFVLIAILFCVLSMIAVYEGWSMLAGPLFITGLLSMVVSLLVSLVEVQLSTKALNVQLERVDFHRVYTRRDEP